MKLMWNEKLGLPDCPYAARWGIAFTRLGSIRVHKWMGPDDPRFLHDHPWGFLTFILKGGYRDITMVDVSRDLSTSAHERRVEEHLRAPAVRYRSGTHRHSVDPDDDGCWSVIVTGPESRTWGFWVPKKDGSGRLRFLEHRRFFRRFGHHACD